MKSAEVAATPWVYLWPPSIPAGITFLGLLLLVLSVYAQPIYRSPAFGQLADQGYHLAAMESFDSAWDAGQFPPAWDAYANGGRGSPGFVLYPPLFAFGGSAMMRLGIGRLESLRASLLFSVIALFFGVFYLATSFASVSRAAVGATAACLLPGATFLGLARGMYPGFLALAWFAVLLGALDRLTRRQRWSARAAWVCLTFASTALVLTHTLTAYMTLCILLVSSPWILPILGRSGLRRAAIAAVAALAATAWFWGPMLVTAAQAQTSFLAESHPYANSLLGSSGSAATAMERSWQDINSIGGSMAVAQLALCAVLAWSFRGSPRPLAVHILPVVVVWIAAASVAPSGEWLTWLPEFDKLQFAWRWQGPLAVLCGAALAAVPRDRLVLPGCVALLAIAWFLPLAQPSSRPWYRLADAARTHTLAEVNNLQPAERAAYLHNRIEMRPIGADRLYYPPGAYGRWEVVSGEASVIAERLSPGRRVYRVEAATPVTMRLLTYQFPGWRAWANGQPLPIHTEPKSGLQVISLPPGTSLVKLRYYRFRF